MPSIVTNDATNADSPSRKQISVHWWLFLACIALVWIPIRVCSSLWFEAGSPLFVQPWIPFVTAFLVWTRRDEWNRTARELEDLFPDPRDPRRSGNLALILVGCLGLVLSNIASVPAGGILSACLIVFGAIFYIFGPFLLRSILPPLLLLLFAIPPPFALVNAILARFQLAGATMFGGSLELMGVKNRVLGSQVTVFQSGWRLNISPSLSGISTFLFVMLATIGFLIWKRISLLKSIFVLIIAAFLTVIMNFLRLLSIGLMAKQNPSLAEIFTNIPALPTILCALAATFLFTRKILSDSLSQEEK